MKFKKELPNYPREHNSNYFKQNKIMNTPYLRQHQIDFRQNLRTTPKALKIICAVTPGGGKSALPLIAAAETAEPQSLKIAWIVPRDSLRRQAEESFINPALKRLTGHDSLIRTCQNADRSNLSRDLRGFVTTYQAVVADPHIYRREFEARPYILFLDEPHHIPAIHGNPWYRSIAPLIHAARMVVFMSGTLERHDGRPIAFLPYITKPGDDRHINHHHPEFHFINYNRYQALRDDAILPLRFQLFDGFIEYEREGNKRTIESIASTGANEAIEHLSPMLQTKYAQQVIDQAVGDWNIYRFQTYPQAKLLIVAPNIKTARKYHKHLKENHSKENALIATSDLSEAAQRAIRKFKKSPDHNVLITVAMAYEGMDVPEISHLVCLTKIRSKPWIEQCICRANRTAPGKESGTIYAPDDPLFNEVKRQIEENQENAARYDESEDYRAYNNLDAPEIEEIEQPANSGVNSFRESMTPSEEEAYLRKSIEEHVRRVSYRYSSSPRILNAQIVRTFNKKRSEMNLYELKRVKAWLSREYPGQA